MHMITSTARRPNASTRSEPVECSCIRQGAWCLSARAAGNGRAIFQCRWKARFDAQPEQSARQPIARNGKFVRRAYSRRALDCEKSTVLYAFSNRGAHVCLRGLSSGEEGRFDVAARSETPKPPAKTTNSNSCDRAAAQVTEDKPAQPGWKYSKYWANIEKRNQINTKNIGNRKGDCAWSCSRWQTQPEKICKLQSTNQYNVRSEWHWLVRCDLQIFSGCVCHLEQLHAQSPFLFPIVFGINITVYVQYAGSGVDQPLLSYNLLLRATLKITSRRAKENQCQTFFSRGGGARPRAPVWIRLWKRRFFDTANRHEKLYGRSRLYATAQGCHETGGVLPPFSSLSFDISIKNSVQRWSSDFQGLFRVKIRKMAQGGNDLSTLPLKL